MAFTCPRCEAVSHHPVDEAEQYCARCHLFVDQMELLAVSDPAAGPEPG